MVTLYQNPVKKSLHIIIQDTRKTRDKARIPHVLYK